MIVCETCNDTHGMTLRGVVVACTRCPIPCQACRGDLTAFCETTPCECECHERRKTRVGRIVAPEPMWSPYGSGR